MTDNAHLYNNTSTIQSDESARLRGLSFPYRTNNDARLAYVWQVQVVTRVIYEFQSDCHIFLLIYEIFIFPEQRPGMRIPMRLIQKLETRQRFFFTIPRVVKIHKVVPSHSFLRLKTKMFLYEMSSIQMVDKYQISSRIPI